MKYYITQVSKGQGKDITLQCPLCQHREWQKTPYEVYLCGIQHGQITPVHAYQCENCGNTILQKEELCPVHTGT